MNNSLIIRTLNEYRPSEKNCISKLVIKNGCELSVFNTQVPYLKKRIWVMQDNDIVTLIDDEIITIEKYLKILPHDYYLDDCGINNRVLPKDVDEKQKFNTVEKTKSKYRKGKVYFDSFEQTHIVIYFNGKKRHKKCFSIKKYGDKSKSSAEHYLKIREKM